MSLKSESGRIQVAGVGGNSHCTRPLVSQWFPTGYTATCTPGGQTKDGVVITRYAYIGVKVIAGVAP
jgi:hypothetical protein